MHEQPDSDKLSALEADAAITLTRLLAEHEEIGGRWRFASRAKVECADILITQGRFSLARVYLRSALDNTPLVPLLVTSLVKPPIKSATNPFVLWGHLRVWALRKCLLCARALGDLRDYLSLCLSLLESACVVFVSEEFREVLHRDLVLLSPLLSQPLQHFPTAEDCGGGSGGKDEPVPRPASTRIDPYAVLNKSTFNLHMRNEIMIEAAKHFHCRMHVNGEGLEGVEDFQPMEESSQTKLIHDESYKVRM